MIQKTALLAVFFLLLPMIQFGVQADAESLNLLKNSTFTDLEGNKIDLNQYKGKVLFLNFWASWCAPCIMEIPSLNRIHERFTPRGLELLSLSLDSQYGLTRIKDIATRQRMQYKVGKADTEMVNELKIFAIPMSYLYGKDGKVIRKYMGPPNPTQLLKDIEQALKN